MKAVRAICLGVLALSVGYIILQKGGVYPDQLFPALFALALAAILYVLVRKGRLSPLPPALFAALLTLVLSVTLELVPLPMAVVKAVAPSRVRLEPAPSATAMTLSVAPELTKEWLPVLFGCVLVFLLARQLTVEFKGREWTVCYPLTAIAALLAILGTVQYYAGANETGASGTYANRNHFAGLLEMCLPFPLCLAIVHWRKQPDKISYRHWPAIKACRFLLVSAVILIGNNTFIIANGLRRDDGFSLLSRCPGLARRPRRFTVAAFPARGRELAC